MHKQLKHITTLLSRNVVFAFVLFSSVILLVSSLYHFVNQNKILENQFANHLHLIEQKENYDNLNSSIAQAEIAINAYGISGDKEMLISYAPVFNSIPRLYNNFKALQVVNANFINANLFLEYNQLVVQKIADIQQIQQLGNANKYNLAKAIIAANNNLKIADSTIKNNSNIFKMAIQKSQNAFLEANSSHNGFAYVSLGVSVFLKLSIFYFLIKIARDRKKINTELQLQKEYFRITIDSIAEGLISTDKKGNILFMNASAEKLTGWSNMEAKDQPLETVYNVVNEETGFAFENIVSRILKNGQTIDFENNTILHTKNNSQLIISNSGSPIFDAKGNISGTVLVFNDISERKKIEKALTASEIFSRGVIDSLSSHIAIINAEGTILKVNKRWDQFAIENGGDPNTKNGVGINYFEVCKIGIDNGDAISAQTLAGIQNVLNGELETFYLEYPCHSIKEKRWFYMRVMKFESFETLVVLEHHDITERKLAEYKTLKAIERYDILAKATSDTIWDWDIVNNTMLYNASITNVFGYNIKQIENVVAWWQQKIHPDDLQNVVAAITEVNKNKIETVYLEYRFCCADGTYKYIFDRAFVIYDQQQKPTRMIGAMQDVSYEKAEEKRIEKAAIDAQEKERHHIGQELHDNVNQILVGALLTLSLAKEKHNDIAKQTAFIETSKQHIVTAIEEVRKLSHELAPAWFDDRSLKEIFEDLLAIVNLNNRFTINFDFNDNGSQIIGEDIQINLFRILQEQVKNILKYAEAAIIDVSINTSENKVQLRIFDKGKGFNAKLAKKGIGLNNIKKRAESFSGKFSLNTAVGKGCEIIVEIPIG